MKNAKKESAPPPDVDTGELLKEAVHRCKCGWLGKKPTLKKLCVVLGVELFEHKSEHGYYRCRISNDFAIRSVDVPDHGVQYYAHCGEGKTAKAAKRNFLRNLRGKIIWRDAPRSSYQCWVIPKNLQLD